MAAVGKPQYGGGFTKKKAWYLNEGDNFGRILPPVKSLAEKGIWAIYETIHWGCQNSEGKKRTFKCIEVKGKDKMIKVRCPMCDLIAENKHLREQKANEYKEKGLNEEQIKNKLKHIDEWIKTFNRDSKWYVNILKPDGEIGRLSFAHTYKKLLDELIKEMVNPPKNKKPVDPIAAEEGVIFNFFYKKGNQKSRVQTVSVFREEVEIPGGGTAEVVKKLPLSENVLNRLEAEAWDLVGMNKVLEQADIQKLVDNKFDPELVDALWSAAKVEDSPEDEPQSEEETSPATTKQTTPTTEAKAAATTDKAEAKEAKQEARLEEKEAAKAVKATTKTQTMSDDEFFKKFGGAGA